MMAPVEDWDALSTAARRRASEVAGREELDRALERRTEEERAAFWKAVGLYYVPKPDAAAPAPRQPPPRM
ncbi:hypothetical protein [Methylobacterium nigriterrae]|uniref:hypothetical protein n=1 Tax=Methylobacterium nigriterrae TaxID=3127512 RepID=UPI003013B4FA